VEQAEEGHKEAQEGAFIIFEQEWALTTGGFLITTRWTGRGLGVQNGETW
jgi:hypothetical protein